MSTNLIKCIQFLAQTSKNSMQQCCPKFSVEDFYTFGSIAVRQPSSADFEEALKALSSEKDFIRVDPKSLKNQELRSSLEAQGNAQVDFVNSSVSNPNIIWVFGKAPATDVEVRFLCRYFWTGEDLRTKLVISLWDPTVDF